MGRINAILPIPKEELQAIWFSENDPSILFLKTGDKVIAKKLKTTGVFWNQAPSKPKAPRL